MTVLAVLPRWMRRKREVFFAGAVLVWILSIFNSLHMLVHSTKRECIYNWEALKQNLANKKHFITKPKINT